jgi:hypothetical protein
VLGLLLEGLVEWVPVWVCDSSLEEFAGRKRTVVEEQEIVRLLGRLRIRCLVHLHFERASETPRTELEIRESRIRIVLTEEAPGLDIRRSCWRVRSCWECFWKFWSGFDGPQRASAIMRRFERTTFGYHKGRKEKRKENLCQKYKKSRSSMWP